MADERAATKTMRQSHANNTHTQSAPLFQISEKKQKLNFDDVRTTSLSQLTHEVALNNAFSLRLRISKDYTPNYYTQKMV